MAPSIKTIAQSLGISVSTVSRALNNHPDINIQTKELVLAKAKELNYTPNAFARGLIHKKSYTVGLMIPDITDPFFADIAREIEKVLFPAGYQVVYGSTARDAEKEKEFIKNAVSRQFDGLILTPDHFDEQLIELLQTLKIPVVFLRRRGVSQLNIPYIDVDHYKAACEAVQYLIELGHKEIGFLSMPDTSFTGQMRKQGYVDTLAKNRLNPLFEEGGRTIEDGREGMHQLLQKHEVTAVFAANDLLGIGALEYLTVHNIRIPEEISVIGFDNIEISALHWIQLTTMDQPRKQMGQQVANLLLQTIQALDKNESLPEQPALIEANLLKRLTCQKL
ncbi:LacI family DNA-binding transcriptional regulator [Lysinibacillus irui]|uniref:LacI family DNA-binding transcriptional regulator n=1 Tax=Lysinibacillus irui TaxID=2998077 RepID=A0AAJ5RW84_9BACI|nr:LacI family DNA-binding transcriptional regulator [Lysinibacillus irui]WDV09363.1 LacI family DNA-binding transcriptional regulator [Lysinibacillus irui]